MQHQNQRPRSTEKLKSLRVLDDTDFWRADSTIVCYHSSSDLRRLGVLCLNYSWDVDNALRSYWNLARWNSAVLIITGASMAHCDCLSVSVWVLIRMNGWPHVLRASKMSDEALSHKTQSFHHNDRPYNRLFIWAISMQTKKEKKIYLFVSSL